MNSDDSIPNLAEIFRPALERVALEQRPLLIALAERLAADRYRGWANAASAESVRTQLLACAAREQDLASRLEELELEYQSRSSAALEQAEDQIAQLDAQLEDEAARLDAEAEAAIDSIKTEADNVRTILAVELLCACQGIDLLAPLKTSPALQQALAALRSRVPMLEADRELAPDIEAARQLISQQVFQEILTGF